MTTYKYLPPERIGFLVDGLIRFTPPSDLNDPFECVPIISLQETREVLDDYIETTEAGILDDIINQGLPRKADWEAFQSRKKELLDKLEENPGEIRDYFFREAEGRINSTIGILSLSKRWDSSLMWAHYCVSHTGFCVGFDRTHPFFQGTDPSTALRDVIYAANRIQVPLEREVTIDFNVMFTKSTNWAYEEEERLLALLSHAKTVIDRPPFGVHLFEVPREAVVEVIVGAKATSDLARRVAAFCSSRSIPAYRAMPSSSSFDMVRIEYVTKDAPPF
jgi:hypothetical protein